MVTRRTFIEGIAATGGSATAAMLALDLIAPATASAPLALEGSGNGTRVVILGAGVAGLCAAHELGKLGYACTILEARARPGGRVWTARNGEKHIDSDGNTQTAAFPEGAYFNPGPARVPQHHVTMDYYREFGVTLEQFGNVNMNAYYHSTKAAPGYERVRMREAKFSINGYTSELLAKAVAHDKLDEPMTTGDKEKLLAFLAQNGGLEKGTYAYRNDGAGGYATLPAAGDVAGTPSDPLGLLPLLRAGYGGFYQPEREIDQQLTMFQPVGGIDALPRAFAARLPGKIRYNAIVSEIRKTPAGVRIAYATNGKIETIDGAFCICTIPFPVLRSIPADFSAPFAASMKRVTYMDSTKVALAFKRRFWEEDDRIMSGISRTDQAIAQVWYPSYGYLGKNGGVLTAAYAAGPPAKLLGDLPPRERIALTVKQATAIHPQIPAELTAGFTVAWQKAPYTMGAWVAWTSDTRKNDYPILEQPDGPIYLAGEHMSYINAWQAGALESARATVRALHARHLSP